MTSTEPAGRADRGAEAHFDVHFIGGTVVAVTAHNVFEAEQKARRRTAGIIARIEFGGRVER